MIFARVYLFSPKIYTATEKCYCIFVLICYNMCYFEKEVLLFMAFRISDECIACGACQDGCPVSCISEGDIYVIDGDICIDCGACADNCPVGAIAQA